MLAKLYVDLAETDKAIDHAHKVVELEPDDTFSYTALSVIYQRCGKIPEAEHAKALAFKSRWASSEHPFDRKAKNERGVVPCDESRRINRQGAKVEGEIKKTGFVE